IRAGLGASTSLAAFLAEADLPKELAGARDALKGLPGNLSELLENALGDELPLLKRDGGFVAAGYNDELDEMRTLRDASRRIVAQMQADLSEETSIRSLKIKHNNVLGYFIEVTANHQDIMGGTPEAKARFIHRQTMANAMRFTTTELADLETRIANAAGRALQIELEIYSELVAAVTAEAEAVRAGANAMAALDVSAALAFLSDQENWCRPKVDTTLAFEIEAGRQPVVEAA
ncbi:unnamed protein product, partial [Laminaria digitata]